MSSQQHNSQVDPSSMSLALSIADDAWEELRTSLLVQHQIGVVPTCLPQFSAAEAERRSSVGRTILKRIEGLDLSTLPHDLALTLRVVSYRARVWSREADWYWTAADPLGAGFFGMFAPTAYCGGLLLNIVHGQLAGFRFNDAGDPDGYLALVADYARLIDQLTERTIGQAQRGIYMPRVQGQQARVLLARLRAGARASLGVTPERLVHVSCGNFVAELERAIEASVEPAFDRACDAVGDAYLALTSDEVGLQELPGGSDVYAELAKLHTTLDLTPEEIHDIGLRRIVDIQEAMRKIRSEAGFKGDHAAFTAHLRSDSRWRATTIDGVTAAFQTYIDRIEPQLPHYFYRLPEARYRIAPLPEALQGSMTFGYYDPPTCSRKEGRYLFNAGNLTQQALFNIGALIYHELLPGHHLHLALQMESATLHPMRRYSRVSAYNEGWAEYAAAFAGELGMYEHAEEVYGRLMMDAFLTCRLVVDTGMNAMGWTLERARNYLRNHSGMTEMEIATESLRYACDVPAQALAYKLGDERIFSLRDEMRQVLGPSFDLKAFHHVILESGALPLPDLKWHVAAVLKSSSEQNRYLMEGS